MFHLLHPFFNNKYFNVPFPAIRYKFSSWNLFFYEPAGASFGCSAISRKNRFQNFEAFHCYLGQKLIRWFGYSFIRHNRLTN